MSLFTGLLASRWSWLILATLALIVTQLYLDYTERVRRARHSAREVAQRLITEEFAL